MDQSSSVDDTACGQTVGYELNPVLCEEIIREMWLVDCERPKAVVRSFELGHDGSYKGGQNLRSQVLNQIEIPVSAIFQ